MVVISFHILLIIDAYIDIFYLYSNLFTWPARSRVYTKMWTYHRRMNEKNKVRKSQCATKYDFWKKKTFLQRILF